MSYRAENFCGLEWSRKALGETGCPQKNLSWLPGRVTNTAKNINMAEPSQDLPNSEVFSRIELVVRGHFPVRVCALVPKELRSNRAASRFIC